MTDDQFSQYMAVATNCQFLLHTLAVLGGFILGALTWHLIIVAKNQRYFW